MLAVVHLILIGILAYQLQSRVVLLEALQGLFRYLGSFGLTLFLVNWANFLLYVVLGWGLPYTLLSWTVLIGPVLYFSVARNSPAEPDPVASFSSALQRLLSFRQWDYWFLFLAGFVLIRFYLGLAVDEVGHVWSNFNFVDTAFHLSVANAFLAAPRFPPIDLDLAPYPLKYHFLADFYIAHLDRLGLEALKAMWLMNLISATVMVGTLWAVFERWLKLPSRWIMLAGFIFLFLNTAIVNLIHFLAFNPPFFNAQFPFDGILRFPYFNFESLLTNLFEPQRGLLFTFPVVLLILHATFGEEEDLGQERSLQQARVRTLQSFVLICLLPLSHIVAFAVLTPSLLPKLWRHGGWFLGRFWLWGPVFVLGVLQLLYLLVYGPPGNAAFSSWDVTPLLPLHEFKDFPWFTRRILFWFFVNGDFLFWGFFFAGLALCHRAGKVDETKPAFRLRKFLWQWKWYFAVVVSLFALINFYRYSFAWGDSNKFVLFFNLGLTLVIVLGAAQWIGHRQRIVSHLLWCFFLVLCLAAPAYAFYRGVVAPPYGQVLLFHNNGRIAAEWLKTSVPPDAVVLTSAYNVIHFVTPLAGLPTLAGIYGDSNPYRQDERKEEIRRVYEEGELHLLQKLDVDYVCVSRNERRRYTLHPKWTELMTSGQGAAFHAGGGPEDGESVFIFDARRLNAR